MRSLLLALALSGCYFGAPSRYGADMTICDEAAYPTPICESTHYWIPSYWSFEGTYHPGHYNRRNGYGNQWPSGAHRR